MAIFFDTLIVAPPQSCVLSSRTTLTPGPVIQIRSAISPPKVLQTADPVSDPVDPDVVLDIWNSQMSVQFPDAVACPGAIRKTASDAAARLRHIA
jgi:hypothetical protein